MNKIILMGRLTRDPEVRYSQGESSLAIGRFSLAVDRRFKRQGEAEADFFNCTAFGKQAEFVEKYLKQGTKILLSGRVQNDNYTNKEGQKVYSVQIIAEEIEFAESKAAASNNAGASFNPGGFGNEMPEPSQSADGFMNIPTGLEEELPFS
ncbi:MAG: single-stranded DNA-binding protein [Lachnospiraceae bacterium]|nr:single-stranded DNA-binding protein [Lachnospiraceae bacterium]